MYFELENFTNNVRELSNNEKNQVLIALDKWTPTIIQNYNTPLLEMLANPLKYAILVFVLWLIITIIIYVFVLNLKSVKKFIDIDRIIILICMIVIGLILSVKTYFSQNRINGDIQYIMTITKPNATKYDYESSPVIRDKLMRNTYRSSRSGSGSSSFLGGLMGSSMGSRRRR